MLPFFIFCYINYMPNITEVKFRGETLRAIREHMAYTQQQLAMGIGCHVNTIMKWEHNRTTPNDERIRQLSEFLYCDPDDFSQDFLEKFRPHAESTLRAMFNRAANAESVNERKLALAIYRTLYPEPVEDVLDITPSEPEEQDTDLLAEGDAPDHYKDKEE